MYNVFMIRFKNFFCSYAYTTNLDPTPYTPHMHEHYEVLFFLRGKATFQISQKKYPMCPMDLIIVPPALIHTTVFLSDQQYERILFHFDIVENSDPFLQSLFSKPSVINLLSNKKVLELFDRINEYRFLFESENFLAITEACFTEILLLLKLYEFTPPDSFPLSHPTVTKIMELISANLDKKLDIDFFSSQLFLSPSHIKNLFSKTMHVGLKHYINNMRIMKAQSLLKKGLNPSEIYLLCGFESYTTFYREYKKFTGKIPSQDKTKKTPDELP